MILNNNHGKIKHEWLDHKVCLLALFALIALVTSLIQSFDLWPSENSLKRA
jgi:hypothetical protein